MTTDTGQSRFVRSNPKLQGHPELTQTQNLISPGDLPSAHNLRSNKLLAVYKARYEQRDFSGTPSSVTASPNFPG